MIERGLADSLGLHLGGVIHLAGRPFRVGGIALTTQQPFYPACVPGLVWVTPRDAASLASSRQPLGYMLDIKLADRVSMTAFQDSPAVNRFIDESIRANQPSYLEPWQGIRHDDYKVIELDQKVLVVGSSLLSLLAIATTAVVVGGRMAEQTRRVGCSRRSAPRPGWLRSCCSPRTCYSRLRRRSWGCWQVTSLLHC